MINLRKRSDQQELMDRNDIPYEAMAQTLKELNIINSRLGGHAVTIKGLKKLIKGDGAVVICEIGCGGGDNLSAIHKYCLPHHINASFIGIDINEACISFARQQYPGLPCQWICHDYALVDFGNKQPDIIFSSLFCHHFTNEELITMLQWLKKNSKRGFFINDLHRHRLAYYLIKYITKFFSNSYLVKNDACISVARSFTRKDWQQLFQLSGIKNYRVSWAWAFRWLIVYNK